MMVLAVGQRILPAFAGMRLLWSPKLMFAALALLSVGCGLRVPGELLAYQGYASWAWHILPLSAVLELAGITAFAINIFGTFILEPGYAHKGPLVVPPTCLFNRLSQACTHRRTRQPGSRTVSGEFSSARMPDIGEFPVQLPSTSRAEQMAWDPVSDTRCGT